MMGIVGWACIAIYFYIGSYNADNTFIAVLFALFYIVALTVAFQKERKLVTRIEKLEQKDGDD